MTRVYGENNLPKLFHDTECTNFIIDLLYKNSIELAYYHLKDISVNYKI